MPSILSTALFMVVIFQATLSLRCFRMSTDPDVEYPTDIQNCSTTHMVYDDFCAKIILYNGSVVRACDNEIVEHSKLIQLRCTKPGKLSATIFGAQCDLHCCTGDLCNSAVPSSTFGICLVIAMFLVVPCS
ncbi:hypothetical protein QR680_013483 [Steinernema hermaphroditum]|uniref:UPAR/Ly6 domain-containing protein n=1 Tax=Steinernema hermaphroditum TaxID=289476 RepID=A0AA39M2K4_9BILA|nr:hypothetical protein QR680_013483 [Steinernema hermaphroditum]